MSALNVAAQFSDDECSADEDKADSVDDESCPDKAPWTARATFILLGSLGFFNVYAMRVNLSIAIMSMVKSGGSSGNFTPVCGHRSKASAFVSMESDGEFDWDEATQGLVLGSFFWGYIITQIPGGVLAKHFGAKWLLGLGCLFTAIFTLMTPIAARYSVYALMAVRVMEGIGEGVTFPAMHALIAKWAPPFQRSLFSSIIYAGSTAGLVVSMPIAGILAQSSFLGGWPSIFYVFGAAGIVWFAFWAFLVYEDPDSHPWISVAEKTLIKRSLGRQVHHGSKVNVPYRRILTSPPFWAILIAHCGQNWGFYTLLTQLPSYVKNVLGFDVQQSGFISSLPYLCLYVVSIFGGLAADAIRAKGLLSTTATRKLYTALAFGIAGICLLTVSALGCNIPGVIAVISLAGAADGLASPGFNVNHIDIAPNYAGVLLGFTNCAATIPGIVAPYVTGLIINEDQSIQKWKIVFMISAFVFMFAAAVYAIFGSGEEQEWNRQRTNVSEESPRKKDDTHDSLFENPSEEDR
ncbi:unnamed protein product [Notodromas monacha]|uniref:Sialin n=1 Tax=Notodromas monacha TaxID=399045 RepID=A0A7R9BFN3_9CRUS|nr:unnamed protein product [Notodromas monacha]CAG0913240.1 unnamed protein product [Notodromas monacha]